MSRTLIDLHRISPLTHLTKQFELEPVQFFCEIQVLGDSGFRFRSNVVDIVTGLVVMNETKKIISFKVGDGSVDY